MTPNEEAEYRKLATDMLADFGEPLFDFFITALGDHLRILNLAGDGIWTGMRATVMKFPPDLLAYLKPYRGVKRIEKLVLSIAPEFLNQVPAEEIEKTMLQLKPYLERVKALEQGGTSDGSTAQN